MCFQKFAEAVSANTRISQIVRKGDARRYGVSLRLDHALHFSAEQSGKMLKVE